MKYMETEVITLFDARNKKKHFHRTSKLSFLVALLEQVVYEPSTDSGLAVIGSNVPYEEAIPDTLCPDIGCDNVAWMEGITSPSQLDRGYLYCCAVQEFRSAVPQAPDLGSAGLLLNWGKISN